MNVINVDRYSLELDETMKIGMSLSGGADSAILLYILMKNLKNRHLKIYSLLAHDRKTAMEHHVDKIVETCSELTGNTNFTLHKTYKENQIVDTLFDYWKEILNNNEVDVMYVGLTKFPPNDVYEQFEEKQPNWHVELRHENTERPLRGIEIPVRADTNTEFLIADQSKLSAPSISIDERVYAPFANLNKKDIASMYESLSVTDILFPVTRSCEDPTHLGSHCGVCWWCNEREWAFGRLE